jgi:hypothetical protein
MIFDASSTRIDTLLETPKKPSFYQEYNSIEKEMRGGKVSVFKGNGESDLIVKMKKRPTKRVTQNNQSKRNL